MSLLEGLFTMANRLFPARVAHAHCDIPCGIYDPHLAQIAALTTVRMTQLIKDQTKPDANSKYPEWENQHASQARYVAVKEHHAELCKQELRILWGDYFKPEHVQQYPELHDLFWNAMKQASKTRQKVDMQAAQDLLATTHKIAEIFWKTKGADPHKQPSLQTGGGELVYPGAKK